MLLYSVSRFPILYLQKVQSKTKYGRRIKPLRRLSQIRNSNVKKVDSVFDEPVILDDNTQEICNEHNATEINYQKGRRMVLVNSTNRTSTKSAFGDHIKSAVGDFLLGSKAFNSFNIGKTFKASVTYFTFIIECKMQILLTVGLRNFNDSFLC